MEIFGWGRKNTADVTSAGQLTVGADGHRLFTTKHSHSTKNLIVTRIYLVPNGSSDDQELEVYVGGTFVYLANGTAVVPTNLLSGKVAGAQGSFYVSDGAATSMTTVSAGLVAGRIGMITKGKIYDFKKESNWIIPPDQCFYASTAKSDKFRGFVSFYYHA